MAWSPANTTLRTNGKRLYNPISPYSDQNYDPLHPYSRQQGTERTARPYRYARDPSNADGTGPSLYYGRAEAYFPGLRQGRGRNANVYTRGSASRPTGNYTGRGGAGGGGGGREAAWAAWAAVWVAWAAAWAAVWVVWVA